MDALAPFRIVTDRLVLRAQSPADAPLVKEAVDSSLDHLRTYMPWAWDAPFPLPAVEEQLLFFGESFARGEDFVYGIFTRDESEVLGGSGLHRRVGPQALEIGYLIRASRVREGLASETARALTRVAFERCGVERVEIRVDPSNIASAGIPQKLGYLPDGTLRRRLPPVGPDGEVRDARTFSMFADEYAGSPCAGAEFDAFDAFDAAGNPV